jgi:membrane-associated phospholipid phosphatase
VIRGWAVRLGLAGWALVMCAVAARGQEQPPNAPSATESASTLTKEALPDAPVARSWASSQSGSELGAQANATLEQDIDVSWKNLPKRILYDQKEIWLFPVQLAKGHYWIPTLAVVGGTAGLIAADPHAMPYFRTHAGNWDDFNDAFDGPITNAETLLVPVTLYLVGGARHDAYATKTALLAGEAYANGAIVDLALKGITRRTRPIEVAAGAPFNDTFFNTPKSAFGSSFPSGHAVSAFSIATVVARRYGHHRWVPWVAYGAATAISFSRVTTRAHFPSDVFVGAALGYSIARFQVLRRR